jgi:hypothetical protein
MAIHYNSRIVNDGLILHLDAANVRSYPRAGSIWNDLSSNNYNGTLMNSPVFNTANGGSLTFNGTNNFVTTSNTGLVHGTGNFSYTCWAKWAALSTLGTLFENGLYTNGILIRFESNLIHIYCEYNATAYNGTISFNPTIGAWYYIVLTRIGNMLYLYANGVQIGSVAFGTSINIQPSTNLLYIGMSQHSAGQCFNGNISLVSVYNKTLSDLEIKQNFNALRGRFNL